MTLVEVLVALAVFTIISAVLASACANVTSIIRKTDRLNKKNVIKDPKSEAVTNADGTVKENTLVIKIGDNEYSVSADKYEIVEDTTESVPDDGGNYKYFQVN